MIEFPADGTPERDRIIKEHAECIESMKGVAGCSVLRCKIQGDTTEVYGGIHSDFLLNRVLIRMRAHPPAGKLVIVCTKVDEEWRIARLSGIKGVPPKFVSDKVYTDEQTPKHDIFKMRLEEMKDRDGFPEDFHEGWKRVDDGWHGARC